MKEKMQNLKEKSVAVFSGVKESRKKIIAVVTIAVLGVAGVGTACYANCNDVETLEISNSGRQLAMYCGEVGSAESKLKSLGVDLAADSEEENTDTEVADAEVEATEEQTEENVTVADSATSSSTSNSSTSSSKSSGSTKSSKSSTASTASTTSTHTHSWQPVYTTITVVDKEAYTEEVPVYGTRSVTYCTLCGAEVTGVARYHYDETGCMGGSQSGATSYIKGYRTVTHEAETHTEQKLTGYRCSCGATK